MTLPVDQRKLATAKLNLALGASLDAKLPKLSLRVIGLFIGRHMRAEHGGAAWPSIKTICAELNISSGSAVRGALYAAVKGEHLIAECNAGATTRYRIAPRYFERATQPHGEATSGEIEIGGEPYGEAGGEPHGEATNTGEIIPENEYRKFKTVNSPLSPPPKRSGKEWPAEDAAARSERSEQTFRAFQDCWLWLAGENKSAAKKEFHRLDEADREGAIAGIGAFLEVMGTRQYRPHAQTYLRERHWKRPAITPDMRTCRNGVGILLAESYGFGRERGAKSGWAAEIVGGVDNSPFGPTAGGPVLDLVATRSDRRRFFVEHGSRQWRAWAEYRADAGESPLVPIQSRRGYGSFLPTEWPPSTERTQAAE